MELHPLCVTFKAPTIYMQGEQATVQLNNREA